MRRMSHCFVVVCLGLVVMLAMFSGCSRLLTGLPAYDDGDFDNPRPLLPVQQDVYREQVPTDVYTP
ncbi:hypothetical protein [Paenibacillus sp. 481]|uniref:hypothetical protein n=1 Tax=Paenibacillus sp. 481 TaxID=2835869 RepID=UPI001E49E4E3|nr:hypothetical protein [Paenibacillus sp. 481]UHA74090.1 hypothetical protein KIK04_02775 [Paenibacillus sp. 481]